VKTPTRAVDRKLLVYNLVGENTNKVGGQKLVGLYTLVGENTNMGGGHKIVGLYSCW
jgi:hypothetical protein